MVFLTVEDAMALSIFKNAIALLENEGDGPLIGLNAMALSAFEGAMTLLAA